MRILFNLTIAALIGCEQTDTKPTQDSEISEVEIVTPQETNENTEEEQQSETESEDEQHNEISGSNSNQRLCDGKLHR